MHAHAAAPPADGPTPDETFVDEFADHDERTHAIFGHLVGLLSLVELGVLGMVGTVVLWQLKADRSPFLDDHGREALNFQLSLLLYSAIGAVGGGIMIAVSLGLLTPLVLAGWLVGLAALWVLRLVGCVRGAVVAGRGEYYRYPCCVRFFTGPA